MPPDPRTILQEAQKRKRSLTIGLSAMGGVVLAVGGFAQYQGRVNAERARRCAQEEALGGPISEECQNNTRVKVRLRGGSHGGTTSGGGSSDSGAAHSSAHPAPHAGGFGLAGGAHGAGG